MLEVQSGHNHIFSEVYSFKNGKKLHAKPMKHLILEFKSTKVQWSHQFLFTKFNVTYKSIFNIISKKQSIKVSSNTLI